MYYGLYLVEHTIDLQSNVTKNSVHNFKQCNTNIRYTHYLQFTSTIEIQRRHTHSFQTQFNPLPIASKAPQRPMRPQGILLHNNPSQPTYFIVVLLSEYSVCRLISHRETEEHASAEPFLGRLMKTHKLCYLCFRAHLYPSVTLQRAGSTPREIPATN